MLYLALYVGGFMAYGKMSYEAMKPLIPAADYGTKPHWVGALFSATIWPLLVLIDLYLFVYRRITERDK